MFDVVEWMAKNGHVSYKNRILELTSQVNDMSSPISEDEVQTLLDRIEEIRREAYDRYDDWKTDPLD